MPTPKMAEHKKRVPVFARVDPKTHAVLQAYGQANMGRAIDTAIAELKRLRAKSLQAAKRREMRDSGAHRGGHPD